MAAKKKAQAIHVPVALAEAVEEIATDYENWVNQDVIDATADAGQRLKALEKQYGVEAVKRAAELHGELDIEMPDTSLSAYFD